MNGDEVMNDMLISIVEQNLPPLPDTVIKLRDYVSQDPDKIEVRGVVDIISKDPLTTANLLKTANSPYYGFSSEISTISQVVALLGIENIKNIVMADSLRSMLKINVSPYGLDTNKFLGDCAKEVDFISSWLNAEDKKLAQLLIPCAMLLRLGMILFSTALIKTKKDKAFKEELKENNFKNIVLVEQDFFGVDHISFLAYCFDHWKFDEILIQTVVYAVSPHAAPQSAQRSAYALAITSKIFEPHSNNMEENLQGAVDLLKEAIEQGVDFKLENLIEHLPKS